MKKPLILFLLFFMCSVFTLKAQTIYRTGIQDYLNEAALRATTVTPKQGDKIFLQSSKLFYIWDNASTLTDDVNTAIKQTNIATGRFINYTKNFTLAEKTKLEALLVFSPYVAPDLSIYATKNNPIFIGNRVLLESVTPTIVMRNTANTAVINALELSANQEVKLANGAMILQGNGGTNTVYVQNNGGNTGFGTNTPTAKVDINGTIKSSSLSGIGDRMVTTNAQGLLQSQAIPIPIPADNLGNHTATQDIKLGAFKLIGGGNKGISISTDGKIGINTSVPITSLHISKKNQIIGSTIPSGGFLLTDSTATYSAIEMGTGTGMYGSWIQARAINSNTSERLTLNPTGGVVGIGITNGSRTLTVNGSIGFGAFGQTDLQQSLANKVNLIEGKQLSTEDYSTEEKTKLATISTGATANSTDADLRDRTAHTGTQTISTVSGLQTELDLKQTVLGFTPYNATNPSGYITSGALTAYLPITGGTLTGSGGNGFIGYASQIGIPATPTSGFNFFANSTNALSWKGTNGFVRTFDGTANTADQIYTLPNASGRFGLLESTQTWTGANTFNTGAFAINANSVIGGTSGNTTTIGNINNAGTTIFSGIGTIAIGTDANSGPIAIGTGAGGRTITIGSGNSTSTLRLYGGGSGATQFFWGGTEKMRLHNNGFVGINNTNPTNELDVIGTSRATRLITNALNTAITSTITNPTRLYIPSSSNTDANTAASGTVAHSTNTVFGVPTFSSTNINVTNTNASNLYIAGAPIAGTNTTLTNRYALFVNSGNSYFGGNVGIGTTLPTAPLEVAGAIKFGAGTDLQTTLDTKQPLLVGQGFVKSFNGVISYDANSYVTTTSLTGYLPVEGGSLTGTSGNGFIGFRSQDFPPVTPATGFNLYANGNNAFSWRGKNGFIRTFDGTENTADRAYTLPNTSGTFSLLQSNQTFTGLNVFNTNVAIGRPTANALLHIQTLGLGDKVGLIVGRDGSQTADKLSIVYNSADLGDQASISSSPTGLATADLLFSVRSSNVLTERMKILSNGNVGINNSNPLTNLDVAGNINTSGYLWLSNGGFANWDGTFNRIYKRSGLPAFSIGNTTTYYDASANHLFRNDAGIDILNLATLSNYIQSSATKHLWGTQTDNGTAHQFAGNAYFKGGIQIDNNINLAGSIIGYNDAVNYAIRQYAVTGSAGLDIHWHGGVRLGDNTGDVLQVKGGSVGIGTIAPIAKLEVRAGKIVAGTASSPNGTTVLESYYDQAGTLGALSVLGTNASSGGWAIGYGVSPKPAALGSFLSSTPIAIPRSAITTGEDFKFYTGSAQTPAIGLDASLTQKMIITNVGNVGINTLIPAYLLHVKVATDQNIAFSPNMNGVHTGSAGIIAINDGNTAYAPLGFYAENYRFGGGNVMVGTTVNNGNKFQVTGNSLFTGNVGIGTASPTRPLEVISTTSNIAYFRENNTFAGMRLNGNTTNTVFDFENRPLQIQFNSVSSATFNTLGHLGLGTTTPITTLHINKAGQTLATAVPSGAIVITDLVGSNFALELGTNPTYGNWIQSRNATSSTSYSLALNPSGGAVGVNTTTPSGVFDVYSTTQPSYPFPRMTTIQIDAIVGMTAGAFVYDTTVNRPKFYNGTSWIQL